MTRLYRNRAICACCKLEQLYLAQIYRSDLVILIVEARAEDRGVHRNAPNFCFLHGNSDLMEELYVQESAKQLCQLPMSMS